MKFLIDTHALIWFCEGNPSLSPDARAAMEDETNERFISSAVAWEMAIKLSLGKLSLQVDYDWIFPGVLEANGFQLLTPHLDDYKGLISLPKHHSDPFDRVIISQAMQRGLTIISKDSEFPAYGVPLLW
jgi:PIN domain nuclease of toxin-antitoxin system